MGGGKPALQVRKKTFEKLDESLSWYASAVALRKRHHGVRGRNVQPPKKVSPRIKLTTGLSLHAKVAANELRIE